MKDCIVAGIDLGTQSLKAVLYDCDQKHIAAQASCALDLISEDDGTREQKTQWYDEALKNAFEKLPCELRKRVQAVGVSGQQHGFVPLDKDGQALYNVKLWNDTSTAEECRLLTEKPAGQMRCCKKPATLCCRVLPRRRYCGLKGITPNSGKNCAILCCRTITSITY